MRLMMKSLVALAMSVALLTADQIPDVAWSSAFKPDLSQSTVVEVPAQPASGFQFPYYVYVPGHRSSGSTRLLVSPNNSGQTTDDFDVQKQSAHRAASSGYVHNIADTLGVPLLIPVFPRPRSIANTYTHYLDRDTMLISEGRLKRIDLQLLAMTRHAQNWLREAGISTQDQVFMEGFSASAGFVNRFAALHPTAVRALAAGALNALPMYPFAAVDGVALPYPLGVGDFKDITGEDFNRDAYNRVSQYLYMGYLDRNDTFPFADAWDDSERTLIARLFGRDMMPDRWRRAVDILATTKAPIQTVTYNGVAHRVLPEMAADVAAFLKANNADRFERITPHEYPFVEYVETKEAHIIKLYWKGETLPENYGRFVGDRAILISIRDWMIGQPPQQLLNFVNQAGFSFDLVSEGHETIVITRDAFCGTSAYGDGEFQGVYVCFKPDVLARIATGTTYTLRPKNSGPTYFWTVNPGVVLKTDISQQGK
jgi:hypothetical protein